MALDDVSVTRIVDRVLKRLDDQPETPQAQSPPTTCTPTRGASSDSAACDEGDCAVARAREAFKAYLDVPLETRKRMIEGMRQVILEHNDQLAHDASAESGLGRPADKVRKNRVAATLTPGVEDLVPSAFTGDHGLSLVENAPYGVIGAIIPCTNPVATVINNAVSMLSAGNAVVFSPHPSAAGVSLQAMDLIRGVIEREGVPPDIVTAIDRPTTERAGALMKHPDVNLLVVTGGEGVVRAAMTSGKKTIAAGPGNPPVVIDETADLALAARQVVAGASFDNNVVCVCEKTVFVVEAVYNRFRAELEKQPVKILTPHQGRRLTDTVLSRPGKPGQPGTANREFVGRNASVLLDAIEVKADESCRLAVVLAGQDHPLVWTEQLMPALPVVKVRDVDEAIELARASEFGYRHSAMMYSRNIDNLSAMARAMNCSLFVKNGPCYAGLGFGGEGHTSFTIASPTGEGLTTARTFTRRRRCVMVDHFRIV